MFHGWLLFHIIPEKNGGTLYLHSSVDGRNPAPVDMVHIPLFAGVSYMFGGLPPDF